MCISKSMMSARYRNKVCCRGEVENVSANQGPRQPYFFICPKNTNIGVG